MPFDWQNLIAMALVLAAAVYLAVRGWRQFARKKAAGCGSVRQLSGVAETASKQPLVQISASRVLCTPSPLMERGPTVCGEGHRGSI